jgi:CRP/FNR family cyclic AMP-dependent transcriptional regulator
LQNPTQKPPQNQTQKSTHSTSSTQADADEKRVFLVVHGNEARRSRYSDWIKAQNSNATIFTAVDGHEALFKLDNVPPNILITDLHLPKTDGLELVKQALRNPKLSGFSIIITSEIPDTEHFIDEVLQGQVQFLHEPENETKFNWCVGRALQRIGPPLPSAYSLKFLSEGENLFLEGDKAESVYILKTGKLKAYKGPTAKTIVLGEILPGEFVGEMSYINHEDRSATVQAINDSQLIEIPISAIDATLFSKPAWAQSLVRTLSKRLKLSNDKLAHE